MYGEIPIDCAAGYGSIHGCFFTADLPRHGSDIGGIMSEIISVAMYEDKEIRCPRLGGQITFGYCRCENRGRPCARAIDCWSDHFDAEAFFRKIMTEEEYVHCFCQPPKNKLDTLLEMIEQAKKTAAEQKEKTEKNDVS
jgi:hypothetical protein